MLTNLRLKLLKIYCSTCPTGYWSYSGSSVCDICKNHYWYRGYLRRDDDDGNGSLPVGCSPCPLNAKCAGGLCLPVADVGYWNDRFSDDPDDAAYIVRCPTASCTGHGSSV